MSTWILVVAQKYPDHLDFAAEDGLWDTRLNVAIRSGDDVYFWIAGGTGLAMRARAKSSSYPIASSQKGARWHDVTTGSYQYRFELESISRTPLSMPSWNELKWAGTPIPASNGRIEIKDPGQQSYLRGLFGGEAAPVPSSDVAFSIDVEYQPNQDLRKFARRLIAIRRGQSAFRDALVDAYDGRCAVTGSGVLAILEAAHIDRYFGEHTNRTDNGLLLRADIHTLFDLQRIAVSSNGTIEVAPSLKTSEYGAFAGKALRVPDDPAARPDLKALRRHWEGCEWTSQQAGHD